MRSVLLALSVFSLMFVGAGPAALTATPEWSMNAIIIEACSCPMFCQCFFNMQPVHHAEDHSGHGAGRYCLGNLAYRVNKASYEGTKLDGAKFWIVGDLGSDFSKGETEWAILTFDPSDTWVPLATTGSS